MPATQTAKKESFFSRQVEMTERMFLASLGFAEQSRSRFDKQYKAWIKDGKTARNRYAKDWKELRSDVESKVNDIRDQISDRFESLTKASR